MRTFLTRSALILLVALSSVALATDSAPLGEAIAKFQLSKFGKKQDVVIYKLEDVRSTAATQDAFAIELGYKLYAYTDKNGFENCASICRAKDGSNNWSARIITVGSQAFCPTLAQCPEGFEAAKVDIHSHLHVTRYLPNDIDRLQLLGSYGPREYVSTYPDEFSTGDLSGAPGYMVSDRSIKFQQGKNKVRTVWRLSDPTPSQQVVAK